MPSLPLGRPLLHGSRLPYLIEAQHHDDGLLAFGKLHHDDLKHLLQEHGALLLRGFGVDNSSFGAFMEEHFGDRLKYSYRSTPRRVIADRIYTSTVYPADREIPLHCENSYQRDWPMYLGFFSALPATTGGETPLADMLRVTARIDAEILERFRRRGVRYVRNYIKGIDLPWTEVFQTNDVAAVERFCNDHEIEFAWGPDDALHTSQKCHATAIHPMLGCEIWFNQVTLFHPSSLKSATDSNLLDMLGDDRLPRNVFYGDGEPIEPSDVSRIQACFAAEAVTFTWNRGDVLVLDNMQVAHGRHSYSGKRLVLVSMSQPYSAIS